MLKIPPYQFHSTGSMFEEIGKFYGWGILSAENFAVIENEVK
jgi:hypothetical protein